MTAVFSLFPAIVVGVGVGLLRLAFLTASYDIAWTLLAGLVMQTRRVRIGVLVTGNTYRYPPALATMAVTVDHLSHGRLILSLGAGWFELKHKAYGIPFHTIRGRARQVEEAIEVIMFLFTQGLSNFSGTYYQLTDDPSSLSPFLNGLFETGIGLTLVRYASRWHDQDEIDIESEHRENQTTWR